MNNHLIPDLTNIVVSYSDTQTYKKLKNIYPTEFRDAKIDEMNLLCNTSYELLLKLISAYNNINDNLKDVLHSKIECSDLIINHITTYDWSGDCEEIIIKNENIFKSSMLIEYLFRNNHNLYEKFSQKFGNNTLDVKRKNMLEIRDKILKNEKNIYETTNPCDYVEIIKKYIIAELEK
jgi:hypothetical protein